MNKVMHILYYMYRRYMVATFYTIIAMYAYFMICGYYVKCNVCIFF